VPDLFNHFQALGIAASMFASSWFLALYTTIFPLPLACRVFDAFLLEVTVIDFVSSFSWCNENYSKISNICIGLG